MVTRIAVDETLELRTYELADAPLLHQLIQDNDAHLRQWLPWLDQRAELKDVRAFISHVQMGQLAQRNYYFGIWHKGQLVGEIANMETTRVHKSAHLGYWLIVSAQGQGIMRRCMRRMIDFVFEELDLNRIQVHVAPGNARSLVLPRKLGFTEEGRLRQVEWLYDHFVDHIVFGLLRSEWDQPSR